MPPVHFKEGMISTCLVCDINEKMYHTSAMIIILYYYSAPPALHIPLPVPGLNPRARMTRIKASSIKQKK